MRRATILALLIITAAASARAQSNRQLALKGLRGAVVRAGSDSRLIDAPAMRTMIELRLRKEGLAVGTDKDLERLPYPPVIGVSLRTVQTACGYLFSLRLELYETGSTDRQPGQQLMLTTWTHSRSGTGPPDENGDIIRAALADALNEFVNDWLTANPKR